MPTPKVRQTPQSRVEKIFREQGFGLVLGLFAVVLAFVFVPVFVVDDLLYVHTVAPEVDSRSHRVRGGVQDLEARHRRAPGVSLRPLKQHNHTRKLLTRCKQMPFPLNFFHVRLSLKPVLAK